jgi:hypothetical protein
LNSHGCHRRLIVLMVRQNFLNCSSLFLGSHAQRLQFTLPASQHFLPALCPSTFIRLRSAPSQSS